VQNLKPLGGVSEDWFGGSVSIDGYNVIVGARGDDDLGKDAGAAYVFKRSWSTWIPDAKLLASSGATEDGFGFAVSISGDYAIVGAPWDDDLGPDSGAAFVFQKLKPVVHAYGTLIWEDITPGDIVEGEITVKNIGDENTELDWEIAEWPEEWGDWIFDPQEGTGLKPGDDPAIVHTIINVPDEVNTEFTGEVKVVNSDDPQNFSVIEVYIRTPRRNIVPTMCPMHVLQSTSHITHVPTTITSTITIVTLFFYFF
jgi:hypothetical protein